MKKNTRELLLDSGFDIFYKFGYQGSNITSILANVGINKGSMYHFFKSKKELGLAVIDERIRKNLVYKYNTILESDNPFDSLFSTLLQATEYLKYGCPLNKMTQEMAYIDSDFSKILSSVYSDFEDIIQRILNKAIDFHQIKPHNTSSSAKFIIACYEGALMIYHLNQNKNYYKETIKRLQASL